MVAYEDNSPTLNTTSSAFGIVLNLARMSLQKEEPVTSECGGNSEDPISNLFSCILRDTYS